MTTRGHPEQILPSQFALDDLEFVRRHSEHELLYFRREEPHHGERPERLVVLDQGVRTWGSVRLALEATKYDRSSTVAEVLRSSLRNLRVQVQNDFLQQKATAARRNLRSPGPGLPTIPL